MNKTLLILALTFSGLAHAEMERDEWRGQDKDKHFIGGLLIGGVATTASGSAWAGFAVGAGVGLLKEFKDAHRPYPNNRWSYKDFLITAAGAGVGATIGHFVITPVSVNYKMEF